MSYIRDLAFERPRVPRGFDPQAQIIAVPQNMAHPEGALMGVRMRASLFVFAFLGLIDPAQAQQSPAIQASAIREDVRILADDTFQGRDAR